MKNQKITSILLSLFVVVATVIFLGFKFKAKEGVYRVVNTDRMSVDNVLNFLGDDPLQHSMNSYDEAKAKIGEDLILRGRTEIDGKKSKRISKYFVCTDCHNLGREFEDITSQSSEDRLEYAKANGQVFLPGSTFWGIYNRTSFYNNDYVKKYGSLVTNSRDTLQNAIQVCTKYCSAGRYIEDWEMEGLMHYYKKHELKIGDLGLSGSDVKNIQKYGQLSAEDKTALIGKIKKSYVSGYAATFLETMPTESRKFGEGGNVETGKVIYQKSCLHCHGGKRVTNLSLDKGKLSSQMFWRNIKNYSDKSLYQIIRHGTYSKTGRKQYMPLYTKEKMSDDQLNDLVAYIKQIAGK